MQCGGSWGLQGWGSSVSTPDPVPHSLPRVSPPQPCEVLPLRGVQAGGPRRPHGVGAPSAPPARGHGPPAHQTLRGSQEAEGGPGAGAQVGLGRVGGFGGGPGAPHGVGGTPRCCLCSGGLIPLRHSPLPTGLGGTGRTPRGVAPQGCAPPAGVAFWGVALLGTRPLGCGPLGHGPAAGCVPIKGLAEAVLVPVLRLGGPTGRAGELPPREGSRLHPLCDAPPLQAPPIYHTHSSNSTHFSTSHAPSRYSCSFIGQCSGPCSQSGASVGGGQRTEKGPFGGRAVTTQGGDNTGR